MSKTKRKKKGHRAGGGKLSRSEVVMVRLNPKQKLAIELAAKHGERSVSAFLVWAAEEAIGNVPVTKAGDSAEDVVDRIWDVDPANRFTRLAHLYPELMTIEQQELWRFICDHVEQHLTDRVLNEEEGVFESRTLRLNWPAVLDAFHDEFDIEQLGEMLRASAIVPTNDVSE